MYDDFGSIGYVNLRFAGELNREGIHCRVFNPAVPVLRLFMNHRDHRKIAVIDGKIGYTGGFNLADEYFDLVGTYGDWKDTGIRLEGEGVRSLTATFLELWNAGQKEPEPVERYLQISASLPVEGYVQPFGDNPLEAERTAENAYIGMIQDAKEYVWLMTPYLMITDEMKHALGLAAKRGVDVRLITPGVPEKKTVYAVTRSYYSGLASQGVRVYEYTPGFLHAKQCIADGKMASIGTSNLDYRSLYLHFENNVMLYGGPAVKQMEQDFMETFQVSREVTEQYRDKRAGILRLWQCVLRLFAPMM
jgi:cardiolipin synthase